MTAKISVLMANLNNGRFLTEAIESLECQTIGEWELIVVDDASSDDSCDLIRAAARADSRIKPSFHKQTAGVGPTKKECAALAAAPILAVLDPDDTLAPDALETHYLAHEASPGAALIWSGYFECDSELRVLRQSTSSFTGDANGGYLLADPGAIHAFWSCKRAHYARTEGFSPRYPLAEDQDLFYKLEEVGATQNIPGVHYYYRHHSGGISTGEKTAEAFGWHLLAMVDAYERRKPGMDSSVRRQALDIIQRHWQHFGTWGLTVISDDLLRSLRRTTVQRRLQYRIVWAYGRETIRRRLKATL